MTDEQRRRFLARAMVAGSAAALAGCNKLHDSAGFKALLAKADAPTDAALHALTSEDALAREFTEAEMSPVFKVNGSKNPQTPEYLALLASNFVDFRLQVGGLVRSPQALSLEQLRALPSRTQITRHDCVEGWSCIGKWKGVNLGRVLDLAGPLPAAKYVVFRCADDYGHNGGRYYESIYLREAYHPQSILAYDMNDAVLPVPHGAPLRVRLERKLGYKQAKYILAVDVVDSLAGIGGGKGGYWEDSGNYIWHGGI